MWRRAGEQWKDICVQPIEAGSIDLSWRDVTSKIQLDRIRILVLPRNAALSGKMTAVNKAEIEITGFNGWKLSAILVMMW